MNQPSGSLVLVARIAGVAVAYYLGALLGLRLALLGGQVTPLWPPTGIALAALLLFGVRIWPGILLGALAVNAPLGPSPVTVVMISAGNTLAPVCACLLLGLVGFRPELARLKDSLALVFLGAFTGMSISAAIGSAARVLTGASPAGNFWTTWSVWWAGDAMGVLIVAPLLLIASRVNWRRRVSPLRAVELAGVIGGTFLATEIATKSGLHVLFLPFPFLVWAALRFQQAGAVLAALTASVVATLAAARGGPPFAGLDLTKTMISLQAFNMSMALTALIHATITTQRDVARREIEVACAQLSHSLRLLTGQPQHGRILEVAQRFPREP